MSDQQAIGKTLEEGSITRSSSMDGATAVPMKGYLILTRRDLRELLRNKNLGRELYAAICIHIEQNQGYAFKGMEQFRTEVY